MDRRAGRRVAVRIVVENPTVEGELERGLLVVPEAVLEHDVVIPTGEIELRVQRSDESPCSRAEIRCRQASQPTVDWLIGHTDAEGRLTFVAPVDRFEFSATGHAGSSPWMAATVRAKDLTKLLLVSP